MSPVIEKIWQTDKKHKKFDWRFVHWNYIIQIKLVNEEILITAK